MHTYHQGSSRRARRESRALLQWLIAALFACLSAQQPLRGVQPDEILKDPALESRARRLSQELRCLVCQNQSIDDSNAPLARDLRVLLRERLSAGDSDGEVLAYLAARYGEFVLLRPPFNLHTWLLWLAPFMLLAGATVVLVSRSRAGMQRLEGAAMAPLSEAERKRLDLLLPGLRRKIGREPEQ
jgi:cytochrome c-type biogenesis protein CcmH